MFRKITAALFLTGIVLAIALPAFAAPSVKLPTMYTMQVHSPVSYWDTLDINLEVDQTACLKAYGNNWQKVCTAAAAAEGRPPQVTIDPPVPGTWSWDGTTRMVFKPQKGWQPEQQLRVTVNPQSLSLRAKLENNSAKASTPPLAARVESSNLLVDRSPKSAHWISATASFNYPAPTMPDAQRFTFSVIEPSHGLGLGKAEYVWSEDRSRVTASVPISSLGSESGLVDFTVNGLAGIWKDDTGKLTVRKDRPAAERVKIPGKKGFVNYYETKLELVNNDGLQQEYRLSLFFDVLLETREVLKHIKVTQLPLTRTPEAREPFVWSKAPYISPDDVTQGTALSFEPISRLDDLSSTIVLRIKPEPGRYVHILADGDLASPAGLSLGQASQHVAVAPKRSPSLSFLQSGNVLALSSDRKISLVSHELNSIHWEVSQMRPELLNIIAGNNPELNVDYIGQSYLGQISSGDIRLQTNAEGKPQFSVLDLSELLQNGKKGLMQIALTALRDRGQSEQKAEMVRLRYVLVTDLGLVLKKDFRQGYEVFACSLADGKAAGEVNISVLGANGLPVYTTTSNKDGHASIPPLSGLSRDKEPTVIVAQKGEDLAYMPLNSTEMRINYDRFETGGRTGIADDSLLAHVFSQRDMFRPGETMHFGAIIRKADWGPLPEKLPIRAMLRDPVGTTVLDKLFAVGPDGLADIEWQSLPQSLSGSYRLDIHIPGANGAVLGSRVARLEEFQPDTLSIKVGLSPKPPKGWLKADQITADISLLNLFGLPAQNRRVEGSLSVASSGLSFADYPDYSFYQGGASQGSEKEISLPSATSDAEGKASFAINLKDFSREVMFARLNFLGFEPGDGRSVQNGTSFMISQLDSVIGYRTNTNLRFVPQKRQATLELIALNPEAQAIDPGALTAVTSTRRYISTLINDRGQLRNESIPQDTEIARSTVSFSTAKGKPEALFQLLTGQSGEHIVNFYDQAGKLVCLVSYMVAGNGLRTGDNLERSTMRVQLEHQDYEGGDTINMALSLPYDGAGLITLERDSVLAHKWFQAKAGDSVQSIVLPPDFAGKGYVNISFARSLASPDIYMQPHTYTVAPFTANVKKRDMALQVEAPERVKPGDTLNIAVKAKEKGRAIVFVVDEGILQLTRFRLPSPLNDLLLDRGLAVETSQNFSLLMPDNRLIQGMLSAFGGGVGQAGGNFQNPFKRKNEPPVVYWSAPVEVGPETHQISVPIPEYYNGKLRIMAVGANERLAGSVQAFCLSQGDVILTPQLPVAVAPGDQFAASIAVSNNIEGSGKGAELVVRLTPRASLSIEGSPEFRIKVDEGSESLIRFNAVAGAEPGEAGIVTHVSGTHKGNTYEATRNTSLSVRPASPSMGQMQAGHTDKSLVLSTQRPLFAYGQVNQASVSSLPLPFVHSLVRYLDSYPYGCTEQIISQAMPYALLLKRPELLMGSGDNPQSIRKRAEQSIEIALVAIQNALHHDGISQWRHGRGKTLLTAYAADFMLEARAAGFGVPVALENSVLQTLERLVVRQAQNLPEARAIAYGAWVLSRHGRITTDALRQLNNFLKNENPNWQHDVTASLIAGSFSLLKLSSRAEELVQGFKGDPESFVSDGLFDPLAAASLHTAILARHFPEKLDTNAGNTNATIQALLSISIDALRENRYATFSAAQSVRALLALAGDKQPEAGTFSLRCAESDVQDSQGKAQQDTVTQGIIYSVSAPGCTSFALDVPEKNKQVYYWQLYTEGYDRTPPAKASFDGIELVVNYRNSKDELVSEVPLGSEVTVNIMASSLGKSIDNVAIVNLLPGGFEMVIPNDVDQNWQPAYRPGNTDNSGSEEEGEENTSESSGNEQTSSSGGESWPEGVEHLDRREDRMIIFTRLTPESRLFSYRIKAVNAGTFTLPAAYAEAMYSRNLRANTAAATIKVVPVK